MASVTENSREGGHGAMPGWGLCGEDAKEGLPEMVMMNKPCHVVSWEQVVPDRRKDRCKGPEVQVCLECGKNSMEVNMTGTGSQG